MDLACTKRKLRDSPRLEHPASPRFRWAPATEFQPHGTPDAPAKVVELQPRRSAAAVDVAVAAASASSVVIRKVYYRGTRMPVDGWFQPCR
jgi:hypothetical protein